MDEFTTAYIQCAMWSSNDNDSGDYVISHETLERMKADCTRFQLENWDMIQHDLPLAGHDFWLTRNSHGAGFWDGEWLKHGDILTERCKEFELYVGDDGLIYGGN